MLQQQQAAQAQQGEGQDPNAAFLQAEQMKAQVKMQSDCRQDAIRCAESRRRQ